jgi:putative methionine-R-sulfoxide reductase with GAF domain
MLAARSNPSVAAWDGILPAADRRRNFRQKPGSSGYAVGDTVVAGRVAELNEILDISESGMGIRALWPLALGRTADFRLDLPKPGTYLEVKGTVVWRDPSGRAGVRFEELTERSHGELTTWLAANTAPVEDQLALESVRKIAYVPDDDPLLCEVELRCEERSSHGTDYTSLLAAIAAVKREVELLRQDQDSALELIASRAQAFTHAAGVAIALADGEEMTCQARAGSDAPPVGARFQIGSGFSGECVRRGVLLHCRDSETDELVDRESCRVLGIRSMVAVPLYSAKEVIGLLEVFSPAANHFGSDDEVVLQRLALIVSHVMQGKELIEVPVPPANVDDEFPVETAADLPLPQLSHTQNGLLISAGVTVIVAILWLIGTWDNTGSGSVALHSPIQPSVHAQAATPAGRDLESLRRLAEQGDPTAQFAMGTRYATGQEVPQDYNEAMHWFTEAAGQGNVLAQSALAAYFWSGRAGAQDPVKAYYWSLIAQAGGDDASKSRIAIIEARLSRSDVLATREEAEDWMKEHPAKKAAIPVR